MVDLYNRAKKNIRLYFQIIFVFFTNGYIKGYADGTIYTGKTKELCLPGLNCYSCPGSLGACPIGALQAVINTRNFNFSYYLLGFFLITGSLLGRFVCGWLCPFGLFQDLLHKIPFAIKIKTFKGEKALKSLKYIMLSLFVIILPMFVVDFVSQGSPWFCKYICPSGTLMAGWPLVILNEGIRGSIGFLFAFKSIILVILTFLSIVIYRPFCKYLCPLGAIYGFFNPISLYKYSFDKDSCTDCKACHSACKMNIEANTNTNSLDCIRCGDCINACQYDALKKVCFNKMTNNDIINTNFDKTK